MQPRVTTPASFFMTDTSLRSNVPNLNQFSGHGSNEVNFYVVCWPGRLFWLNASRHTNHWRTVSTAHCEVPNKDSGTQTDRQEDYCDI